MEQETINISILQMNSTIADISANIDKVNSIIENSLPDSCDVLVLPEVWPCGWSCKNFIKTAYKLNNHPAINFLSSIAKKYHISIIGGSVIVEESGNYYNSCPIIDKNGDLITVYNKNHLYSYYGCDEGKYITAGDNPVMVNLYGLNFGLTICYDIRFPEIYRAYAKAGADVLVNCAAWGISKPIPWEMMTKARAVENQCYMIALTQCGEIENGEFNLGHSRIIDYKGEELNSIIDREGIISATLSKKNMYEFRQKCQVLNDIKKSYEVKILCAKY